MYTHTNACLRLVLLVTLTIRAEARDAALPAAGRGRRRGRCAEGARAPRLPLGPHPLLAVCDHECDQGGRTRRGTMVLSCLRMCIASRDDDGDTMLCVGSSGGAGQPGNQVAVQAEPQWTDPRCVRAVFCISISLSTAACLTNAHGARRLQQYCVLNQILEFHGIIQNQLRRLVALKGFLEHENEDLNADDPGNEDVDLFVDIVRATFQVRLLLRFDLSVYGHNEPLIVYCYCTQESESHLSRAAQCGERPAAAESPPLPVQLPHRSRAFTAGCGLAVLRRS